MCRYGQGQDRRRLGPPPRTVLRREKISALALRRCTITLMSIAKSTRLPKVSGMDVRYGAKPSLVACRSEFVSVAAQYRAPITEPRPEEAKCTLRVSITGEERKYSTLRLNSTKSAKCKM